MSLPAPYLDDGDCVLHLGDCVEVMAAMEPESVDAVVCDPPYGLEFMGKEWDRLDAGLPQENVWKGRRGKGGSAAGGGDGGHPGRRERVEVSFGGKRGAFKRCTVCGKRQFSGSPCTCDEPEWTLEYPPGAPSGMVRMQRWHQTWATEALRVLKPGGHLLAFGGTRTFHRLTCAIEDAGFEIRDAIGLASVDVQDLLGEWISWSQRVPSAGLRLLGAGDDSAPAPVLLGTNLSESPARALIAELRLSEAHHTHAASWRSALSGADDPTTGLSALVTIAGDSPVSPGATSTNGSTAPSDAPAWLGASMEARTRAVEALRIWRGSGTSSRQAATAALCAALTDALKVIICAQSETFRNYDTTLKTVSACATTATTTASTAASLIAFTADTLDRGGDATEAHPGPLAWIYGSGFPPSKSLDVSKAIDKRAEVNQETARRIALVGAVIREYRERAGMTPQQVSEAVVGTPSGACWNWEHQQLPSLENWGAVKATLAIPDDYDGLLDGDRSRFIAAERAVIGLREVPVGHAFSGPVYGGDSSSVAVDITAPATPEAAAWQGWGTALKPAWEPIVVARKPLAGTVAANVLAHGTGALNVDGCRVEGGERPLRVGGPGGQNGWGSVMGACKAEGTTAAGRWPANVVLSHTPECREVGTRKVRSKNAIQGGRDGGVHNAIYGERRVMTTDEGYADPDGTETVAAWECHPECPVRRLDEEVGERPSGARAAGEYGGIGSGAIYGEGGVTPLGGIAANGGGPSRFFYTAKASSAERDGASHPTVKPVNLMRWLVRLVTPPGGVVLDPFLGSGTTALAARAEGFRCIGIERELDYCEQAARRLRQLSLFSEPAS